MHFHLWQFQAHKLALAAASLCWPCASNRGWYDATCLWMPYQFLFNINATEYFPGEEQKSGGCEPVHSGTSRSSVGTEAVIQEQRLKANLAREFKEGDLVPHCGLCRATQYNRQETQLGRYLTKSGRWEARLSTSDSQIAVRPSNLVRVRRWRPPDEVGFVGLREGYLKASSQQREVGSQSVHNTGRPPGGETQLCGTHTETQPVEIANSLAAEQSDRQPQQGTTRGRTAQTQTDLDGPPLLPNSEDEELTESQIFLITRDITRAHLRKTELPAECQRRLTIVETMWRQLRSQTDIMRREMLCKSNENGH